MEVLLHHRELSTFPKQVQRQSSSGKSVCRRKATTIASSSIASTVDFGSFGPVRRSATEVRFFHFATVFWLIP
jgi:hypothetical protein